MAAIHYLDHPRKAGVSKLRLDAKRGKAHRSRHCASDMDTLLRHAYVARLDETLFCPSNTLPIDSPFLLSSIVAEPLSSAGYLEDTDVLQNNEAGGVLVNTATDVDNAEGWSLHQRTESHVQLRNAPQSITWRSQDVDSIRQDVLHGALLDRQLPFISTAIQHNPEQSQSPLPQGAPAHEVHGSWATLDSVLHPARPPLSSYTVDHSAAIEDDHRGSYDFGDFLDRWHRRDIEAPGSVHALQVFSGDGEPGKDIVRDAMLRERLDMQGLRWDMVDRQTALTNRCCWHPASPSYATGPFPCLPYNAAPWDVEAYYRFRRFSPQHRAEISHHQLRNVVASTNRSDILYAAADKVYRTSLSCTDTLDTVIDLSTPTTCASGFRITCLATSPASHPEGVVFAGGFSGEYALLDFNTEAGSLSEGFVSHAYNSVVTHISTGHDRSSGSLRAAFCSNDRCLRVMDVATARFVHTQQFEHAINCSDVSNASRLRVVVGDCEDAFITDADRGEVLATLESHTDHIFSCAWSPDGRFVATGAEDGKVSIWDARYWKYPLATRSCVMSTARSLHFTDDGFLVAAEDEDVVCIYEPQNFTLRQSIRFFGAVSGVALLDGGAEIVVANGDRTVGGLLSFQRAGQGLNAGTYGEKLPDELKQAGSGSGWRRRRWDCRAWGEDFDVLV